MASERAAANSGRDLLLAAVGVSCLVFLSGLGRLPLFGRDEALYAEAAREMHATGDWITPRVNGVFFFEKPPLLYWLNALSYSAFGATPFAARLPVALMGVILVALTTALAARLWGRRAGILAGVVLITCPLVAMVARMGIMDIPLTCLMTVAMLAYGRWRRHGGLAPGAAFGLLVGLALLLKGMAGGLVPVVAVVHALLHRRRSSEIALSSVVLAALLALLVAAPWFLAMSVRHGQAFLDVFIGQQQAQRMTQPMQGHGGPFFYYLALIAFAFFPWVAFLPAAFARGSAQSDEQAFWRSLAIVWFLVVLVPFSLISTKLPGYILPLFPPMALLVAAELDRRIESPGRGAWVAIVALGSLFAAAFCFLPALGARLGERYAASADARLLVLPAAFWVGGYAASIVGAFHGLAGRVRAALGFMIAGQLVIVGALLLGILPVLSPYLGGGPAYLAQVARRELPGRQIVLYETHPEAVAFALQRTVTAFSRKERAGVYARMIGRPIALIAPMEERAFWESLPYDRIWRRGTDVLIEAPWMPGLTMSWRLRTHHRGSIPSGR